MKNKYLLIIVLIALGALGFYLLITKPDNYQLVTSSLDNKTPTVTTTPTLTIFQPKIDSSSNLKVETQKLTPRDFEEDLKSLKNSLTRNP